MHCVCKAEKKNQFGQQGWHSRETAVVAGKVLRKKWCKFCIGDRCSAVERGRDFKTVASRAWVFLCAAACVLPVMCFSFLNQLWWCLLQLARNSRAHAWITCPRCDSPAHTHNHVYIGMAPCSCKCYPRVMFFSTNTGKQPWHAQLQSVLKPLCPMCVVLILLQ